MKWELIIFDCDGVLVDSEPIADRVFPEVLAAEGIGISQEEIKEWFTGYSLKSCLETIQKRLGIPAPKNIKRKYYSRLFDEFKKSLQPIPGINKVLDTVPYPICVASSGEHEKMQVSLNIVGLLAKFKDRIFSATEVVNGKPAPDLFLYAAEKCNADPKCCAVIEDSVPGVKAGIAAGMTVFAYINPSQSKFSDTCKNLGAVIFNTMKDLPVLLEKTN